MNKFTKNVIVLILPIMMLLPGTVNVAFSPLFSRSVKNAQKPSDPQNSAVGSPPRKNDLYYNSEQNDRKPNAPDHTLFGLSNSGWNTSSSMNGENGYSGYSNENPSKLVIGVDNQKPWAYANIVDEISRSHGTIENTISTKDNIIAIVADVPLNAISSFKEKVQSSGLARYVEPKVKFQASFVPNDPYWGYQWGPQKIEANYAWNTTVGTHSVLVAVVDTGIDYGHPDLAANYVPLGYDWVNHDNDPKDDNGHGTHCVGIIAAVLNNAMGIAGIANISIMAEKGIDASGSGWDDDLANAIVHAVDKGANVISNSWGSHQESTLIHDALRYAYDKGVLLIAAAGNDATNARFYPAAYDEVVAVTATDSSDNPASFTDYGSWVEVAAPGVNIYSTFPTYHVTLNDPPYGRNQNYDYLSGTSMACPHVAGLAALALSRYPNASRDWIRARLRYSADDLGPVGFDDHYGYGRINARKAVEQTLPAHDVLVFDYKKPRYVQPSDIASFNVTVLNFGTSGENSVTLHLLVNGSVLDSRALTYVANLMSATTTLSWNPMVEGTYNVTIYILPVPGETNTENNVAQIRVSVMRVVGFVLFDQTHYCDSIDQYSTWVMDLTGKGYVVDPFVGDYITSNVLASYSILVVPQARVSYASDEILAIRGFVMNGGGLLVVGDDAPSVYTSLTNFAGITWDYESFGWSGYTSNITLHKVTEGVAQAYFAYPSNQLFVSSGAEGLIRDGGGHGEIMLAVSRAGAGRVVAVATEGATDNNNIGLADNEILSMNMIDWLHGVRYAHELTVSLDAPIYLEPNNSCTLNATVYNRGLNSETNVRLGLFINHTIVGNVTLLELTNGSSYTMNYVWTPTLLAVYNVTAAARPVPQENVTSNNVKVRLVNVQYPLIRPVEGQYADYIVNSYQPSGAVASSGNYNFTYSRYVAPYKILVTVWIRDPSGFTGTFWLVANTMNRLVESGLWAGLWYPGWIQTGVNLGSVINLLYGPVAVNGSKAFVIGARAIDCWETPVPHGSILNTFWHDKASGLWIGLVEKDVFSGQRVELWLVNTNVPIGTLYEHDLGATVNAPHSLLPHENSLLSATVYNLGTHDETNVELRLSINDTQVANGTILTLSAGGQRTMNYSWTPAKKGVYFMSAYALPVPNENVTINNVANKTVYVRYTDVALISDNNELSSLGSTLDSMLIGYDVLNRNSVNHYTSDASLLCRYQAVLFYKYNRLLTASEHSALELYLSCGGNLLVTGQNSLGNPSDPLMADIVRSATTGDDYGQTDLFVADEGHPIMNGPYGSFLAGYHVSGLYPDCDMAQADVSRNATTVARLADGYSKIIAVEDVLGKVVYWNGDGVLDWTSNSDCENMLKNLMHWFTISYAHELVVLLEAPKFIEFGKSATVNATVENRGTSNETDVRLELLVNGKIVKENITSQLPSRMSQTISHFWSPTVPGTYNVTAHSPPVLGENVTANNVFSQQIRVQYLPRILVYVQYSDLTAEYPNTLDAVDSTFGHYNLTELTDSAQLDYMIAGKDILLIPEQENADLTTMQTIGSAWSGTLANFLNRGGTIIVCDYTWGTGGTYGILTGAGLMSISACHDVTGATLHLVAPADPIAQGVSSSFNAPDGTISFVTNETNVVVNDGTYAAVIHKIVRKGNIALLGFDFYLSNANSERILGNAVALATGITVQAKPSTGSIGEEVTLSGAGATPNGSVSVYWDGTFIENTTANSIGDFSYSLSVPTNAMMGMHTIMTVDAVTGKFATALFKVLLMVLNPSEGPVGTQVTIGGDGFSPSKQVTLAFNDMLIGYATTSNSGNFTFTFNTPVAAAGTQTVKTSDADGNSATAVFTVIDTTPLQVEIDVGAVHFTGEMTEFIAQTTFRGQAVNANIMSATLHKPDGTTETLSAQPIALGLCMLQYTVADYVGTYTLVIVANYSTSTVRANGTSFKCFSVSNDLQSISRQISEIRNGTATLQTDLGLIRIDLKALNLTLQDIFVRVISINGTVATIQTTLGTMTGTITSIDGRTATISLGVDKIKADISSLQSSLPILQYVTLIIALIAAVGSTLSLYLLRSKKTPSTQPEATETANTPPPETKPEEPKAEETIPEEPKPPDAQTADANPSNANPSNANPSNANPSNANPSNANPSNANPSNANPPDTTPSDVNPSNAPAV